MNTTMNGRVDFTKAESTDVLLEVNRNLMEIHRNLIDLNKSLKVSQNNLAKSNRMAARN